MSVNIVLTIGPSDFLLQQEPLATIAPLRGAGRYVPATVVHSDAAGLDDAGLRSACLRYASEDDVWSEHFLEVIILQSPCGSGPRVSEDLEGRVVELSLADKRLPPGPYVIQSASGAVHAVYKLYRDMSNAFVGGVVPDNRHDRYRWLQCSDCIPVPSILYSGKHTEASPLSGMRFGVKDVIDVAGLETGCGSKCYRSLYPSKQVTSPCVQQLVSAGAVLVGKLRCCQWCDNQDPLERFEEVTPTNPRGDGFQKPSGSSSGSAAACASYPWLDFTIGTDTGGSIRHPAGVNGVYGIRPSHGSTRSFGVVCTPYFDTTGVFARSARVAEAASRVMADQSWPGRMVERPPGRRYRLLYAVEPGSAETSELQSFFPPRKQGPRSPMPAGMILENFVQELERYLQCRRQEVCMHDLWKATHPSGISSDLVDATNDIYQNLVYSGLANNVVGPFLKDYRVVNGGRMPFIEPIIKERLDYGARVSAADQKKSEAARQAFATWVNSTLLPNPSGSVGDDEMPILIYPQSQGRPQYRDEASQHQDGEIFWSGFSPFSISYCSGCPDFTLPVGEVSFRSRMTETEEYLPVAISLLGPRDSDSQLLSLITELEKEGVLRPVQCGTRMYP